MARGRQRVRQRQLSKAVSPGFAHLAEVSRETGSEMRVRPFALLEAIQAATGEMYGAGQFAAMDRDPRNDTAFGPLDPLAPEAIDPLNAVGRTDPRVWQYQVGWNLPGNGNREVPWQVLRAAADSVGIMRRCIEVRKKHVRSLRWNFGICEDAIKDAHLANPRQGRLDVERELRERLMPEIKRLRAFWNKPWKSNDADMGQWINAVMEDYLVLDAVAIFPRRTYGNDIHDFEILDATTIKPLLDNRGARPVPPFPAFQQILYGFPRGEWMASAEYDEHGNALVDNTYSDSELFYRRENFRSASPYGFSPTEMALFDARLYLQRQKWMLAEYDDGSTPLTWVETAMPEDGQRMTLTQQRQWEKAYNAKVQGQTRERHRIKVLPNGWKATQMTSVDERYKPEYDLHLIKLLASYYGVPIAELGFTEPTGLGNNSWYEGQAEVSGRLGLRPDTAVVTDVINALSGQFLKMPPELEGSFVDPAAANTAERETVIAGQRGRGSITLNEERAELGQSLLDFPEADMYWMATPTGPIFIQGSFQRAQDAAEASKMQAQAQVVGTAGKLELEHKRIEDGQAARAEGRDFAREQFQAQQEAGVAKSAEIAAYRNWSRKHPEDEPRRPFMFKCVTPDDGFPELEGIGPWRVSYEGWEWQVWDEITKSAMSWLKWNALHPTHPRGPNGRWVKAHSGADLISALQDEGHRVHAGQAVDAPSSVQGMDIQVAASSKDLTLTQLVQGDHLTPAGRKAIEALGPTGHPRIAAIPDTEGKIREAHRMLGLPGGGQDSYVAFSDLRKLIGDQVTRVEVDDTLRRMAHMPGVRIVPQSYGRENMVVRVPAALKFGGQEQDLISIDEPSLARPSQFSAYDMADELDNRAAGRPGHPLMTLLSDAELQAEIDKRAANDPFMAREMAQRLKAQQAIDAPSSVQGMDIHPSALVDLDVEIENAERYAARMRREMEVAGQGRKAGAPGRYVEDVINADERVKRLKKRRELAASIPTRQQQIEADIRAAYAKLKGRTDLPTNNLLVGNPEQGQRFVDLRAAMRERGDVFLADLRDELGEKYGRQEVDTALTDLMAKDPAFIVGRLHAQSILMQRDRDSVLNLGGNENHYLHIVDPEVMEAKARESAELLSRVPKPMTARQRQVELMALGDELRFTEPGSERHGLISRRIAELSAQVDITPDERKALGKIRPAQLPDEPDDLAFQAQLRQARINVKRDRAEVMAELEELHFINQGDLSVQSHRFEAYQRGKDLAGDPHMQRLREAMLSEDSERLDDALTRAERELGLERIGGDRWLGPDQMTVFDPKLHKPIGQRPGPNEYVFVVRPGYWANINGERVLILKAKVQSAEPVDIARFKELSKAATLGGGVGPKALRLSGRSDLIKAGEPDPIPPAQPTTPPGPLDARWPGWLLDAAIAAAVTALLIKVLPDLDFSDLLRRFGEWSRAYRPGDPMPDVRLWITQEQPELRERLEAILRGPIQQAHVEGALVGQRGAEAVIEAVLRGDDPREMHDGYDIDWGDWTPGHRSAAEALLEPGGLERLLYQSNVMIKSITETRLDQIGRILGEGLARGDTPEAIARVLRERMIDNRAWAHRIAVTETNRAMSYASVMTYRDAGMAYKGWMTAFDQTVCKICLHNEFELDGTPRVVPIDELFPSGDPWPPAHPHCRCAPIPVIRFSRGNNIDKSAMSWAMWNLRHPEHPRAGTGRYTKSSFPVKLRDAVPAKPAPHGDYEDPDEETIRAIKFTFTGEYAGFHVRNVEVHQIGYETVINGDILDKKFKKIGSFERAYSQNEGGELWARHSLLEINKRLHGQGFAHAFNNYLFDWYRESGVKGVMLHANIDVGGYAWARSGYDWANADAARQVYDRLYRAIEPSGFKVEAQVGRIPVQRRVEQMRLANDLFDRWDRLWNQFGADDYPTPYEVSQLGRWPGAGKNDWWIGKALMMGSSWDGVRYLEPA